MEAQLTNEQYISVNKYVSLCYGNAEAFRNFSKATTLSEVAEIANDEIERAKAVFSDLATPVTQKTGMPEVDAMADEIFNIIENANNDYIKNILAEKVLNSKRVLLEMYTAKQE